MNKLATILFALVCTSVTAMEKPSWKLFRAIEKVESSLGKTSSNVYQLQPDYVADVNRIQRKLERVDGIRRRKFKCEDVFSRQISEKMMMVFWSYYSKRVANGDSYEVLAKLHRVGFVGLTKNKHTAGEYWKKVNKELRRFK